MEHQYNQKVDVFSFGHVTLVSCTNHVCEAVELLDHWQREANLDLKPTNVLLRQIDTDDPIVKLADFGLILIN